MVPESFVYSWTRKSTGEFYYGMHKGLLNDGYIGSGVMFNKKFSKNPSDWYREIVFRGTDSECRKIETEYVTEALINTPLCLNMMTGGRGGDTFSNKRHTTATKLKISKTKKGTRTTYTEAQIDLVRKGLQENKSLRAIAKETKVNLNTVFNTSKEL